MAVVLLGLPGGYLGATSANQQKLAVMAMGLLGLAWGDLCQPKLLNLKGFAEDGCHG